MHVCCLNFNKVSASAAVGGELQTRKSVTDAKYLTIELYVIDVILLIFLTDLHSRLW